MAQTLRRLLAVAAVLLFATCHNEGPPATVASVTVTPRTLTVGVGATAQLTATPKDANGTALTGRVVTWASDNTAVATVSSMGLVGGVAQGQATITATSEGQSGTAALTVVVLVASVTVTPTPATVGIGQTVQLTATPKDANGNVLTGRVVTWASNNTAVATVGSTGLVSGVAQGQATITATSETKSGTAAITVIQVPVASVTVTPATPTVFLGQTVQLTATPKDANGNVLNGRVVTWASDNTAVATVSSTGLVTGVTQGQATITATSEAKNGTAAVAVVSLMLAEFSAGGVHTCGVTTSDGAFCWGSNSSGQLGGSAASECEISYYYGSGVPCSTTAVTVAGGFAFAAVSAGRSHTCGLTTGGAAYCWGDNVQGQLGDGSTISSGTPVPVAGGLMFGAVSAGDGFTCGLTASGAAYCWGYNGVGELGNGTTTNSPIPVAVTGMLTFTTLSTGDSHACGLTSSGAVYCWGANRSAQLGDGTTTNRTSPMLVAGGLTFTTVSAGLVHTCGLATSGAAYCWGANDSGELGDGSTVDSRTPLAVAGGLTFQVVSAGGGYTCGVTTTGAAYCWGANYSGQLGTGTFSGPSLVPAPVSGGLVFGAVSAGGAHTCGRTTGGTVYCWGGNSDGELGNGSTNGSAVPVRVLGQP